MTGGAVGQVVQHHHDRLGGGRVHLERAVGPAVGVLEVAGDRVPEYDGVPAVSQIPCGGGVEQMRPEQATTTVRPEQLRGVPQRTKKCVAFGDFVDSFGCATAAEGQAVGQCVVADLVAFFARACCEGATGRITQFVADGEERGEDAAPSECVQDGGCHVRLRTVVEGQADRLNGVVGCSGSAISPHPLSKVKGDVPHCHPRVVSSPGSWHGGDGHGESRPKVLQQGRQVVGVLGDAVQVQVGTRQGGDRTQPAEPFGVCAVAVHHTTFARFRGQRNDFPSQA